MRWAFSGSPLSANFFSVELIVGAGGNGRVRRRRHCQRRRNYVRAHNALVQRGGLGGTPIVAVLADPARSEPCRRRQWRPRRFGACRLGAANPPLPSTIAVGTSRTPALSAAVESMMLHCFRCWSLESRVYPASPRRRASAFGTAGAEGCKVNPCLSMSTWASGYTASAILSASAKRGLRCFTRAKPAPNCV
jgi:hypothetical protein